MAANDTLLSIGRFARHVGLSARTLRRYDELGLIAPARVDPDSGYRWYSSDQVAAAQTVRRLRELELPLADIQLLLADPTPEAVYATLREHRRWIAGRLAELQIVLASLQPLLDGKEPLMADVRAQHLAPDEQRKLAANLFNRVWSLLENPARSPEQDDEMLHAAHASRFHWGEVGERIHRVRGEWQCSRVYAVLGRGEPALHHAQRCLELCAGAEVEDFDLPFAHEALARAYVVLGDRERALEHYHAAGGLAGAIEDADDRALVQADLASLGLDD